MGFGEAQRQSRHCRSAAGGAGHCPVAACQSSPHSPNRAGFGEIRLSLKVYYVDQSAFRVGAQVEVGNTDPQSATRIRRIRELQSMVPEFVAGTGGSKWLSALPTGSRWGRALPARPERRPVNRPLTPRSTPDSGRFVSSSEFIARINVLSGWGLGRRLSQKGGLPNVPRPPSRPAHRASGCRRR